MRRLQSSDYQVMPWRNGGGTTTELVIGREGEDLSGDRFLYRISIADVGSDGPFSLFEGYDRHIMLIDGPGMTLDCGAHGRIELRAPFEPRAFSGDWDVAGALTNGPVRDFNLIVDRARASATLDVRILTAPETVVLLPGSTCIVHILEGELTDARAGDTLVSDNEGPLELLPQPKECARVAIALISRR